MQQQTIIVRRTQVPAIVGLSKSTIDRLRKAGDFPAPILLGQQALGFLRSEIEAWLATRPRATQ